ncbi:MAG: MacB family efflux pump subunit [Paraburkholderia sp.]|uniref:MacB family efflux pump subunit n=1 Tax=Paraburkholderia sp. TaxID=1926495 RepID=UPI003C6921AD
MGKPLLQLHGVSRRITGGNRDATILRDIDLSIHAGEIVAIVGPSGSGKSTLLNILGCLDHPSSGNYRIGDHETRALSADELAKLRREHFGFIFQRYHLLAQLSALDNVEMPAVYSGITRVPRRQRALDLLASLGLAEHAGHRPGQLSGGQQQRVCIARALMNGGSVILADEPTGALDSKSGEDVLRVLLELNAKGHTIIIVTHDARVAALADRIVEIGDGRIVDDRRVRPAEAVAGLPPAPGVDGPCAPPSSGASIAALARIAWRALLARQLRTLLTMLGVVIGITSVISVVALGEGARRDILKQVGSLGTHTIGIYPGADWGDSEAGSIETLVPGDVAALRRQPYVDSVTPETGRALLIRARNVSVEAFVSGVGERYFRVHGLALRAGRSFDANAVTRQQQVAVIDENTQRKLFGPVGDPLGQVILVGRLPCVVIGVVSQGDGLPGSKGSLNVWMPYSTVGSRLLGKSHFDSITVLLRDGQPGEAAEAGIVSLLKRRHGVKDFFTSNTDSIVKTVERTGRSLTLLLSLIAAVSLVVGGIGVMNVMLVSVTERTREIGIRMAVGARQTDILRQFLMEAVMVCLPAGVIGIVLSLGLGFVFSMVFSQWQMTFSAGSIAVGFLSSTLIGIVFGFVPARRASQLNPVIALAHD